MFHNLYYRIVPIAAIVALGACTTQQVIQPSAKNLQASQVAVIATAKNSVSRMMVSLDRVTDASGKDVATFGMVSSNTGNSVIVTPGRYEVKLFCLAGNTASAFPIGKFELRAGYTYTLDCRLEGLRVFVVGNETATETSH
jgi:hypothetical protein